VKKKLEALPPESQAKVKSLVERSLKAKFRPIEQCVQHPGPRKP